MFYNYPDSPHILCSSHSPVSYFSVVRELHTTHTFDRSKKFFVRENIVRFDTLIKNVFVECVDIRLYIQIYRPKN